MMRSMFSGVSGLKVHQVKMDIIGNNIANVNTVGFKSSNVTFAEIYSQTVKGAGSPSDGIGGTNPQQIGLGVNVGSIAVNHSKGSTQRTDVATDIMIDGNGFFMLTNDANAQNIYYSRAGNFTVDESGYLVDPNGYKVLGSDLKPVQINASETVEATATTGVYLNGNLNFNAEDYSTTMDLYDSLGDVHTWTTQFKDEPYTATAMDLTAYSTIDKTYTNDENVSFKRMYIMDEDSNIIAGTDDITDTANSLYAMFDSSGNIVDLVTLGVDPSTTTITDGDQAVASVIADAPDGVEIAGAKDIKITIDKSIFYLNGDVNGSSSFTQYSQETDAKGVIVDGNSAGTLSSYSIAANGEVEGVFTNGESSTLATIGLASFDNPAGMLKIGNNLFTDSNNSGTPKYGEPSTGSFGALTPGALEMSNVDLAAEFTNMITTQRGFQANSRVITTSDEILQELVNLKR